MVDFDLSFVLKVVVVIMGIAWVVVSCMAFHSRNFVDIHTDNYKLDIGLLVHCLVLVDLPFHRRY